MSLSNEPTVLDIQKESTDGAAEMAATASTDSSSPNPYSNAPKSKRSKTVVTQSDRNLRPRGEKVDYAKMNDEDDEADYSVRDPKSKLYILSP